MHFNLPTLVHYSTKHIRAVSDSRHVIMAWVTPPHLRPHVNNSHMLPVAKQLARNQLAFTVCIIPGLISV